MNIYDLTPQSVWKVNSYSFACEKNLINHIAFLKPPSVLEKVGGKKQNKHLAI